MSTLVKAGATLVALLVDRSGSMANSLQEMEGGLNSFIADQAALPGDAALMLAEFDHEFEVVWPLRPLQNPPHYRISPRGRTALYDAVGYYITDVNQTLATENTYRPVVMCIVTDGAENASKEWDRDSVRAWIAHQQDVYGWTFVFLGANLDAVKVGAQFGVSEQHSLTFDTDRGKKAYRLLSEHVADIREGKAAEFTADDRRRAIGQ